MRLIQGISVAGLLALTVSPAQAFFFLLAAGAANPKPLPPPKIVELPALNPNTPIRPSGLPAPYYAEPRREMPRLGQLAQVSNEELLRRLERLEQENERLRRQQGAPAGNESSPAPRGGLPGTRLPEQVTSGWWVHLHNYNTAGDLGSGPVRTYRYDQQEFAATLAFKETNPSQWSEIFLYRFEAWLRVKEAGNYQIGALLNCAWSHPCNYSVMLDGIRIAQFQGQHGGTTNQLVFGARQLEPGDYRMEMVFHIPKTKFIKYEPNKVKMHPKIRTSGDMNFRDFSSTELLIPDRRDVPMGPPIQRSGW